MWRRPNLLVQDTRSERNPKDRTVPPPGVRCAAMIEPAKIGCSQGSHGGHGPLAILLACLLITVHATAMPDLETKGTDPAVVDIDLDAIPGPPEGHPIAGAVIGRIGRRLVIFGGMDAPEDPPTPSDPDSHREIRILDLGNPDAGWTVSTTTIPRPLAYGVGVTHPRHGVISIGGDTGSEIVGDTFQLTGGEDDTIRVVDLPDLPEPLAYAAAALVEDTVVVMGGRTVIDGPSVRSTWRLNLKGLGDPKSDAARAWTRGADIPGPARMFPVAAAHRGAAYLFSGVEVADPDTDVQPPIDASLLDAWRYDPAEDAWTELADSPRPLTGGSSPAIAVGWDLLAVMGGHDGTPLDPRSVDPESRSGLATDLAVYHPITDRWTLRGETPSDPEKGISASLTTGTVRIEGTGTRFDGTTLIATGNDDSRIRGAGIATIATRASPSGLAWLDWFAIAGYGLVLVGMGFYFARREETTDEYFLAGRRIPWWASGISIFATSLSAITFMAIPAKAWDTDWTYFLQNMGILVVAPFAALFLVPAFRRLEVTTAYEYLEHRFHWSLRLAASALYMLFQVGRVAVVTLLPAIALSAVTGMDVVACILIMGAICILYTVLGGIEAVIWSDVLQTVVLFGGAAWALVVMVQGTEGGLGGLIQDASSSNKLQLADLSMDLTRPSLLVILLGAIFTNLIPYASDQSVVQRYLAVKDERDAKRAVLAGAFLALPASVLFFALGTGLWGFYRSNPDVLQPTSQLDQVLPLFIVDLLPAGVAGIVLAGLFAAAMSSLDSAMNSVATAFTTDWYRRFRPEAGDRRRLVIARIATITIGIVGTGAALLMVRVDDPSLLDVWFKVIGLFGSGVAGVFLLGALTRRTGPVAGWSGLVASAIAVWTVGAFTSWNGLTYAAVGILTCVSTGLLVGIVDRRAPSDAVPERP